MTEVPAACVSCARFRYLKVSLALVLGLVGVKMLGMHWIKEWFGNATNFILLGLIFMILIGGGLASWVVDRRQLRQNVSARS